MDAIGGKVFGTDAECFTTYRAIKLVAEGAIRLTKRYAAHVASEASKAAGRRRDELEKMAASLEWIAAKPARTYWEALQMILIYQLLLHTDAQAHGVTLGRIDQYCGHFLEKELAEGSITVEEAQEIADAFVLKLGDYFAMQMATLPKKAGETEPPPKKNVPLRMRRPPFHGGRTDAGRAGCDQHPDAAFPADIRAALSHHPVDLCAYP
jgi:formate C-acetyltransferase